MLACVDLGIVYSNVFYFRDTHFQMWKLWTWSGTQIPEVVFPLDNEELETMTCVFNPAPSSCFCAGIYCAVVQYIKGVVDSRQET